MSIKLHKNTITFIVGRLYQEVGRDLLGTFIYNIGVMDVGVVVNLLLKMSIVSKPFLERGTMYMTRK